MVEFKEMGRGIVTLIAGIDGEVPNRQVQISIQEMVNHRVNKEINAQANKDTVTLTINENPTRDQRQILGDRVLYIAKFDVDLAPIELTQKVVNSTHNTVVDVLKESGFNISGTATVWDGNLQQ